MGELNDSSLDNGRDLAVFSNAASALRAVQSGVSPGSENPDTCHTNLARLVATETAVGGDVSCFGLGGTMNRNNMGGRVGRLGLVISLVLALGGCGQLASQQPPVQSPMSQQAPLKLPPL